MPLGQDLLQCHAGERFELQIGPAQSRPTVMKFEDERADDRGGQASLMSVRQQKNPKSGDQRRISGGAVVAGRKQIGSGPSDTPLLNSVRVHCVHPGASKTAFDAWCWESISRRSLGSACVDRLEFRNVICILTSPSSTFTFEIQSE